MKLPEIGEKYINKNSNVTKTVEKVEILVHFRGYIRTETIEAFHKEYEKVVNKK